VKVGILGSGLMGAKLGTIFARAGHEVVFSHARSEAKLKKLESEARGSAKAGAPAQAADGADAVLLAVHWLRVALALPSNEHEGLFGIAAGALILDV
jgi:hypothetical protein